MAVETKPWDPSEYLDDEEAIAAYLDAAFESGDPADITRAIGTVAKARGMTRIAEDTGLSRESLYRALSGEGNPGFGTVLTVMKALGLRLSVEPQEGMRG